jgi:anti-anti-sigma factor
MSELVTFASDRDAEICVIRVKGELDMSGASDAFVYLMSALEKGHRCVRVDCSELSFIDAAGLASLIAAARRAQTLTTAFLLVNVQPVIRLVIDVTQTSELLLGDPGAGPRRAPRQGRLSSLRP